MIETRNIIDGAVLELPSGAQNCWVNVVKPTQDERNHFVDRLGIVEEFAAAMVDDEERSHVDYDKDDDQALIIIDCPYAESTDEAMDGGVIQYATHPLSILFLNKPDNLVTVSTRENEVVQAVATRRATTEGSSAESLLLELMMATAKRYLSALQYIDRQFKATEHALRDQMNNEGLVRLLSLEKSLVYFSTSLKSFEAVVIKLATRPILEFTAEERETLEDVVIEVRQAIEMCDISQKLLSGSMEAFGQVINNNMNVTMRRLTIITLVLAVPTMVFSFYGMNTPLPLDTSWLVPIALAAIGALVASVVFLFGKRFK